MGTFYRQTGIDLYPNITPEYSDVAVFKNGCMMIADENGNWQTPVNVATMQSYKKEFGFGEWQANSNTTGITDVEYPWELQIPITEHNRSADCNIVATYVRMLDGSFLNLSMGVRYDLSELGYFSIIGLKDDFGNITLFGSQPFDGIVYIDRIHVKVFYPEETRMLIWIGTEQEYLDMPFHDPNCIYLISELKEPEFTPPEIIE